MGGPLRLAMAIHGGGLHQPLPLIKEGYEGEDRIRGKRSTGWALWEEGVSMNSTSSREVDDQEEVEAGRKGKKIKRLSAEQVRALEASFEEEKKLEPEKKQELALQLGLQPRQVAVWFQNRRARSKTKQLELDFAFLSSHYRSLLAETHRLKSEVARLTKELNNVKNRTHGVPVKSTISGTLAKEDMFEEDNILGVNLTKNQINAVNSTKDCPSPCSAYSVIADCESSTSKGIRDTSVYECNSFDHLKYSCILRGWAHEESLFAAHGFDSSSYNTTLQPQDLVLDELPLTNAMIHATTDWLWESSTI